jgi:ribosomal protein L30
MSSKKLKVTYTKSSIGYPKRQKDTVRALGLRKLGSRWSMMTPL